MLTWGVKLYGLEYAVVTHPLPTLHANSTGMLVKSKTTSNDTKASLSAIVLFVMNLTNLMVFFLHTVMPFQPRVK